MRGKGVDVKWQEPFDSMVGAFPVKEMHGIIHGQVLMQGSI